MTVVCPDICSACGYPTLGPGLCYFCWPLVAANAPASILSSLAEPTGTAQETPVLARATARPPRADAEHSSSSSAASPLAAAG